MLIARVFRAIAGKLSGIASRMDPPSTPPAPATEQEGWVDGVGPQTREALANVAFFQAIQARIREEDERRKAVREKKHLHVVAAEPRESELN